MTDYSQYPKAPYLTDNNVNVDMTPYSFIAASMLDGTHPSDKFNQWVDLAYKAKKPMVGVVRIDPHYYSKDFTLGFWPLPENDLILKILKPKLLAPDGVTKYKVDAILIDMRTYYEADGSKIGGAWIGGVVNHVRDVLKKWGFKTFLLTDYNSVALYPNTTENPSVMLTNEKSPIAVYQKGNVASGTVKIPWANSAFLWWYGSAIVSGVLTPMFVSLLTEDKLNALLGTLVPPEPPVVIPPVVPPVTGDKLDLILSKLDVIIKYIQSGN
jgi:hypothetical protein